MRYISPEKALITGGGTDVDINAALQQAGSGTGAVFIGPGVYTISHSLNISNSNTVVICDRNAVFWAQSTLPAGNAIATVATGITDVIWKGGVFDGGNTAARGIQVNTSDRITLLGIELRNCAGPFIIGANRASGTLRISRCYLHGGISPGISDLTTDGNTAFLQVLNCNFESITNYGCGSSNGGATNGVSYFEVAGNRFKSCGVIDGSGNILNALYGFQCGNVNWHDNEFVSCTGAIHADTCGSGSICDNFATGSTASIDFFAEITPYISVERNIGMNSVNHGGVTVGVGGSNPGVATLLGVVVRSNKIVNCQGGIYIGACNQPFIEGNIVKNPSNGTAFYNSNSVGTHFAFNQSSFASGGTHLICNGAGSSSTVFVYGDATNAATQYSPINGGTISVQANPI